jgi:hypothetical protein
MSVECSFILYLGPAEIVMTDSRSRDRETDESISKTRLFPKPVSRSSLKDKGTLTSSNAFPDGATLSARIQSAAVIYNDLSNAAISAVTAIDGRKRASVPGLLMTADHQNVLIDLLERLTGKMF